MTSNLASSSTSTSSKIIPSTNITTELLSRAHSSTTTQRLLNDKLHPQRPLHLKPTDALSSSTAAVTNARNARRTAREIAKRRRKTLKPKPLSAREKRAMCIYELSDAEKKYAVFEPLHALWVGYMQELLQLLPPPPPLAGSAPAGPPPPSNKGGKSKPQGGRASGNGSSTAAITLGALDSGVISRLASADFHGAKLQVSRSRCVSRVGVEGIVVRDSKFAFEVVTGGDKVRVLLKEHTVFRFEVPWPVAVVGDGDGDGGGGVGIGGGEDGDEERKEKEELKGKAGNGGVGERGQPSRRRNLVFELHGDQFQYRAVDRANKKFKTHFLPDL